VRPRRRFAPEPPRPARNELVNENIRSAQVRLIDEDGSQVGVKEIK
jgi:translation initiation factor IF-3